ncbi:MAG TPA: hypothetical protein EYI97_02075 [Candidatus Poseidoniales archaeon]|nr:hypothetical protein [Candidatus Poseidoniales archaeon]
MKRGVLLLALLLLAPFASAFGAPVEQDVGRAITTWDVATETGVTVTGDVGGNLLLFAPGEAEPESEQLDENPIDDVVVSADGERFVAISGKFLTLYGRTGGPLSHHDFAGEIPLAAAISPSGDYYAAAYDSGNVRLWWFLNKDDVRLKWEFPDSEFDYSDEQRDEVRRGLNATSLLEMSSDYIAVAGKGKLYVVLRNDGSLKQAYPLDGAAQQLEISDDGGTLCLATQGSLSTYLFSGGGSERSWRFESPEQDSVHAIGLAPDGSLLAVLHGSSSQVVTGFTPDSSEPAWEFELETSLIGPALAVSDNHVAVAGWGLGEPDLLLLSAGGKLLASTVSDAGASSVQCGGGRVVTNSGDALANYALPVAGGDSGGFALELPVDTRTLGLAVAALLLLAGAVGAFFYLDIDLPFGGGALPPAPPSSGAPLKVKPIGAAGTVTIACPGCGARMKVPKLGRAQKVKCGECGLAGTAEI